MPTWIKNLLPSNHDRIADLTARVEKLEELMRKLERGVDRTPTYGYNGLENYNLGK